MNENPEYTTEDLLIAHIYHGLKTLSKSQDIIINHLHDMKKCIDDMIKSIEELSKRNSENAG